MTASPNSTMICWYCKKNLRSKHPPLSLMTSKGPLCILCLRRLICHDLPGFENAIHGLQSIPPPTEEELREDLRRLGEKYEFDEKKKKWVDTGGR